MINLFVEGGRVRFDVNVAAAAARDLTLSSRLLRVARNTSGSRGTLTCPSAISRSAAS